MNKKETFYLMAAGTFFPGYVGYFIGRSFVKGNSNRNTLPVLFMTAGLIVGAMITSRMIGDINAKIKIEETELD